jgi:hypothetical protein
VGGEVRTWEIGYPTTIGDAWRDRRCADGARERVFGATDLHSSDDETVRGLT